MKALYNYQVEGVDKLSRILEVKPSALLADDMGLGKTAQAIHVLKKLQPRKVLIVCPASLTENWKLELLHWCPNLASKVSVTKEITNGRVDICSYDILAKNIAKFTSKSLAPDYDFIILDEAHYVKNPKAKRTKAILSLVKKLSAKTLLLSGTPITSFTRDLFIPIHMAYSPRKGEPGFKWVGSAWAFYHLFCDAKRTRFGWDTTGTSNKETLRDLLSGFMVRRLKSEVLKELPEKIRVNMPIPLDTIKAKAYAEESLRLIDKYKNPDGEIDLNKARLADHISTARKRLGDIKIKSAIAFIKDLITNGEVPVIFAIHLDTLQQIKNELESPNTPVSYIDGTTKDRQGEVDKFQNGTSVAFIGQMTAAGAGITLTRGTCCVIVESGWNPSDNYQAEDRIHRIGQKKNTVIYYLSTANSLDYLINETIVRKASNINSILN